MAGAKASSGAQQAQADDRYENPTRYAYIAFVVVVCQDTVASAGFLSMVPERDAMVRHF